MADRSSDGLPAFVFKNRGALLALPAAILTVAGKPSAASIVIGLPVAFVGELIRCWAVGYTGETTRGDEVSAPELITGGPYAYVRNPLYAGNFVTAVGFAIAFTGKNSAAARSLLASGSLAAMAVVYATIVPHEEAYLRGRFGDAFDRYCAAVPPIIPAREPMPNPNGRWRSGAILSAESKTFVTFGAMLAALAFKAMRA